MVVRDAGKDLGILSDVQPRAMRPRGVQCTDKDVEGLVNLLSSVDGRKKQCFRYHVDEKSRDRLCEFKLLCLLLGSLVGRRDVVTTEFSHSRLRARAVIANDQGDHFAVQTPDAERCPVWQSLFDILYSHYISSHVTITFKKILHHCQHSPELSVQLS